MLTEGGIYLSQLDYPPFSATRQPNLIVAAPHAWETWTINGANQGRFWPNLAMWRSGTIKYSMQPVVFASIIDLSAWLKFVGNQVKQRDWQVYEMKDCNKAIRTLHELRNSLNAHFEGGGFWHSFTSHYEHFLGLDRLWGFTGTVLGPGFLPVRTVLVVFLQAISNFSN